MTVQSKGNERPINWQADETAEQYKKRVLKYYGEKGVDY